MSKQPIKTKIIVWREGSYYWWRAPIKIGKVASVELRPMYDYESAESAKAAGERHVKRLFPGIVLE